jgi:hypothetical protein
VPHPRRLRRAEGSPLERLRAGADGRPPRGAGLPPGGHLHRAHAQEPAAARDRRAAGVREPVLGAGAHHGFRRRRSHVRVHRHAGKDPDRVTRWLAANKIGRAVGRSCTRPYAADRRGQPLPRRPPLATSRLRELAASRLRLIGLQSRGSAR